MTASELAEFNRLATPQAEQLLLAFCGSPKWAAELAALRPFAELEGLAVSAAEVWQAQPLAQKMAAFAAHPRIGERNAGTDTDTQRQVKEQSHVMASESQVLDEFDELNVAYFDRFGFTFIVCAAERQADEMLALLRACLQHSRDEEVARASIEQEKITLLRISKHFAADE
ncbi:MAG: 2-oxo-4-hydroxy-4-carboxy-5-ureidoimidazoline decarboxylase [Pseudomonadota bacterium]